MRQRHTHTLTVYESVESDETDSLGDPLDAWSERLSVPVEAYPPGTLSSGGSSRTGAGIITDSDMVAMAKDPAADAIAPGADHAVLERATDTTAEAYVVERVRALTGRGAAPETWEIHLAETAAGTPEDYL